MSQDGDLFALGDGVASEPTFEVAFRGYNQRQVDQYFHIVEAENLALAAERDSAFEQVQGLAAQIQQLQHELTELRQHRSGGPAVASAVSFKDLGPLVGQILGLAE